MLFVQEEHIVIRTSIWRNILLYYFALFGVICLFRVTVQLLGKQINDYRDILTRERKERFDLQEKRDKLTREIDDFKLSFGKFMSEMNQRINKAKHEQGDLSNEVSNFAGLCQHMLHKVLYVHAAYSIISCV